MTIESTSVPHRQGTMAAARTLPLAALTAIFAGGNVLSTFLQMAGSILTARLVEPAVLGLFNGMGLVLGYVPFLQLGISNGLHRELPYYVGKGEWDRAYDLTASAQAWCLAVGGLTAAALLGVSFWELVQGKFNLAAGWAVYAINGFILFYGQHYLHVTYRSRNDFARLTLVTTIRRGVGLIMVLLVWWLSFYGLCLRSLATEAVFLVLLWYWRPVPVSPRWNWPDLRHLLKIGAPIFGVNQLYIWWTVLDSTLVLKFLGVKGLGLYALALLVGPTIQQIPAALTQICYPRMAEEYGRSGLLRDLFRMVNRPMVLMTLGMVPLILIAWAALPPATHLLLPKYEAGVPAARWALIPAWLMCLMPALNVFNVAKRMDLLGIAVAVGLAAYFGSLLWLTRNTISLAAFPQAMALGRLIFLGFCFLFLARLRRREKLALG
jgi:O-antigen/teichoic acid export membrane protein